METPIEREDRLRQELEAAIRSHKVALQTGIREEISATTDRLRDSLARFDEAFTRKPAGSEASQFIAPMRRRA